MVCPSCVVYRWLITIFILTCVSDVGRERFTDTEAELLQGRQRWCWCGVGVAVEAAGVSGGPDVVRVR